MLFDRNRHPIICST